VPVTHTGRRLYNLDTEIAELADVAAQHPDVVARLQKLVQKLAAGNAGTSSEQG